MLNKLKTLSIGKKILLSAAGVVLAGSIINASAPPQNTPPVQTTKAVIITKTVPETEVVHFESKTEDNSSLAKGATSIKQAGVDGVRTRTYEVTTSDGKEISKKLISDKVTTEPVTQITENGTYVAPPPPSQSPESGATARCSDGTLSYSAHASGTCSHHGGVGYWINHP